MAATGNHKKSSYEEGSLDQYLRDISAYPLISRDEEVRLAQRIRQATKKKAQLSLLHSTDDELLMATANKVIVPPAELPLALARIVVAAARAAGTRRTPCIAQALEKEA